MKAEDKQLLIEDLCTRLPYGVKISVDDNVETLEGINVPDDIVEYGSWLASDIEEVKPYLFPISSMTEEQKNEYNSWKHLIPVCRYEYGDVVEEDELWDSPASFQYLIENHFDYHGLIEKGLAIDATGKNIY